MQGVAIPDGGGCKSILKQQCSVKRLKKEKAGKRNSTKKRLSRSQNIADICRFIMGLLSLFSKKQKRPDVTGSFTFLGADMHNHLLPGLDDGSKSVEESIDYITTLSALGYKKLICTPHIISDLYFNSRQTIEPAYDLLKQAVADAGLDVELSFAAEFMINPEFSELYNKAKCCLLAITIY